MTTDRRRDVRPIDGERRFRMAFDAAGVGMALLDLQGRVLESNNALHELLGYHGGELAGMTFAELAYSPGQHADFQPLTSVLGGQLDRCSLDRRYMRKDGTLVWARLSVSSVRDAGHTPRYGLGILADISGEKALEDRFLHSQKLATIGRLAGGVVHDFANLLTIIGGYGEFIVSQCAADDPRRGDAEEIRRATDHASGLTRQLLALTRSRPSHPQAVDVNVQIRDLAKLLSRAIGDVISMTIRLADEPCTVVADTGQLQQVVLNLVVNARDAMPAGGSLLIETAKELVTNREAACGNDDAIGRVYVRISVTDDGCGIPEFARRRVFEPYFTTQAPGDGAGLGLSTVYAVAQLSGGFVRLRSEIGRGTTFDVLIPCANNGADAEPIIDPTQRRGGETILLVEDDDAVRRLATRTLANQGYTVIAASSGNEAVALAASYTERIHAVVTDVVMPGLPGPKLVARLEVARPDIRVLFISGHGQDMLVRFGVVEEETEFLRKPFTPDELVWRVRQVLD